MTSKADQRTWLERDYPQSFQCKFCGCTITINLRHKEVTTVTKGHDPDCVMAPR